jgi:hypothetical protein
MMGFYLNFVARISYGVSLFCALKALLNSVYEAPVLMATKKLLEYLNDAHNAAVWVAFFWTIGRILELFANCLPELVRLSTGG